MNRNDRIEKAARDVFNNPYIGNRWLTRLRAALDYNPGKMACELRAIGMKWDEIAIRIDIGGHRPAQNASGSAHNYAISNGITWPIEVVK